MATAGSLLKSRGNHSCLSAGDPMSSSTRAAPSVIAYGHATIAESGASTLSSAAQCSREYAPCRRS